MVRTTKWDQQPCTLKHFVHGYVTGNTGWLQ